MACWISISLHRKHEIDSTEASSLAQLRSPPTANIQDLTKCRHCHCENGMESHILHTYSSTHRWQTDRLRWWYSLGCLFWTVIFLTSLVKLEIRASAGVKAVPLEFPGPHSTHPSNPRTWWRNPVRDPLLWLSSCPPPFSTSCVGFGTRSWCVSRWGWGWARAPRGVGARCTCWRGTLSRARAAALWCKQSACACSPRPLPCKGLKHK